MILNPSPLHSIEIKGFDRAIYLKRDDLLHPIVSGNKWRKLHYAVQHARQNGYLHLVTFGGAYSNHMVATACACAQLGLQCSIFVRGHEPMNSHYLKAAQLYGAQLIQVTREQYRNKTQCFQSYFNAQTSYFIDEGGKSNHAHSGLAHIIAEIDLPQYTLIHASATGTTAVGLALAAQAQNKNIDIHSIAVLNNEQEQRQYFAQHQVQNHIHLHSQFTLGGYAKTTEQLMQFCKQFIAQTGIMIDPVYTGKALWALKQMLPNLPPQPVVFLHTGGTLGLFSQAYMEQI